MYRNDQAARDHRFEQEVRHAKAPDFDDAGTPAAPAAASPLWQAMGVRIGSALAAAVMAFGLVVAMPAVKTEHVAAGAPAVTQNAG
jgi:hypothetical protein